MPTGRCSLPAFFLDGLQKRILIAPVVNDTEHHDILFLLIDQVIGNIILHQDAPRPSFRLNI